MHTEGLGGFNEPQHGVELSILGVVLLEIDLTSTAHAYGSGGQQGHNGNPLHQLRVPARSQPLSSISPCWDFFRVLTWQAVGAPSSNLHFT